MVLKLSFLNSPPRIMSTYQISDHGAHFEKIPSPLGWLAHILSIPSTYYSLTMLPGMQLGLNGHGVGHLGHRGSFGGYFGLSGLIRHHWVSFGSFRWSFGLIGAH